MAATITARDPSALPSPGVKWQIQDIVVLLVVFAVVLSLFSVRRWSELNRELSERKLVEQELRKSRQMLSTLLSSLPGIAYRCAAGEERTMHYVSDGCLELTGYRPEDIVGSQKVPFASLIHEDDGDMVRGTIEQALESGRPFEMTYRIVTAPGEEKWVWEKGRGVRDARDESLYLEGFITDINDRKQAEEALRRSETRFRLLAENATDVVYRLALVPEFRFQYVSPAIAAISGHAPEEFYRNPSLPLDLVHPEDRDVLLAISTGEWDFSRPVTARWTRPDGGVAYVEMRMTAVHDGSGAIVAVEGIARDITSRKEMEEQLKYLSLHDSLTGLYNRTYFEEELRRLDGGREYPITIISTDIDGLKLINDTMGHEKGDEILRVYGEALTQTFRKQDVVARIGGDEFAAILPRTDAETADSLYARLDVVTNEYNDSKGGLYLGVSFGSATAVDKRTPIRDVLKQADQNMYRDKIHRTTSAVHGIVKTLLTALAAKDYMSEGHISRVTVLACLLGEALGLSKNAVAELALLAEVHDLGKVGMPDRVLFKEGSLSSDEREQIKQHPTIGYRIARSSPELSHVADLILHHHEWWNGTGYPMGLKGEKIPVACRILSIVDAFDAMTNDRPYRKAMPQDKAVEELQRFRGVQFDPRMVDVFVELLNVQAADPAAGA